MRQVLDCLLAGCNEAQIGPRLGLSPHTVHNYVKSLYRRLRVSGVNELYARFVRSDVDAAVAEALDAVQ